MKIFIFGLLTLVLLSVVSADIIAPSSHPVKRCVRIGNLENIDGYYLIGYISGPMEKHGKSILINEGECLNKGYKFNTFEVLAVEKEKADIIGISNVNPDTKGVYYFGKIETYGGAVPDSNPLIEEDLYYKVIGICNGKLKIGLEKKVMKYNNGDKDYIEEYKLDENCENKDNEDKGIIESIICFIRSLFGMKC